MFCFSCTVNLHIIKTESGPGNRMMFCHFRYSYDPFQQSLNDNPEYELPLSSGDYVLIWGNVDDVSNKSIDISTIMKWHALS